MSKVFKNSGSERPVVPVETPALAGSLKQESYHFSGERFNPFNTVVAHTNGEEIVLIPYGVADNLVERCEFGGVYARSDSEQFQKIANGAVMLRIFDRLDNDAKLFGR